MGILDSIWEEVEDFGSTAWEGIEDAGTTVNRLYEDDFLKNLESFTKDTLGSMEDLVKTDEYKTAATMALTYWAGGGEGLGGEANSLWGAEGTPGSLGTEGMPEWVDMLKQGSDLFGSEGQQQAPQTGTARRTDSYTDLIGKLDRMITNEIDPFEEIIIPTGARY